MAAIADETFADGPLTFGTRVAVDRSFAAAGLRREVAIEVSDTQTFVDFVRHGLAVAFLAPSFVREMHGIALVSIRNNAPVFDTYIAEPTTRRISAAASALLDLAK